MQNYRQKKQIKLQLGDSVEKTFKEYAKLITQSVQKLNSFTDNLEGKVNTMLKAQQTEFVDSYKNHMQNIKNQLKQMQNKLLQYQKKIDFYQNESRLAHYIKKVNFMQTQQIKLYELLEQKDKKIKQMNFQLQILKKQKKATDQKIKKLIRSNILVEQKKSQISSKVDEREQIEQNDQENNSSQKYRPKKILSSIETFTTEVPIYQYTRKRVNHLPTNNITLITEDQQNQMFKSHQMQRNLKKQFSIQSLQKDGMPSQVSTLEKQIKSLKQQNKKLLLFNSKYASNLSELGEFFVKTVNDLKKSISYKKKVKQNVSFQQFCKQDKLALIATLLSNQAVLWLLYDKIFKPDIKKNRAQSVLQKSYGKKQYNSLKSQRSIEQIMCNPQKQWQIMDKNAFPLIKNKKLIY